MPLTFRFLGASFTILLLLFPIRLLCSDFYFRQGLLSYLEIPRYNGILSLTDAVIDSSIITLRRAFCT